MYYCLVDIFTNKIQSWTSDEYECFDEDKKVYKLNEQDSAKLDSLSPKDEPYFDGNTLWIKKAPRDVEEIDQDVEDMILLLAEILGTDNTEESDE